MARSGFPIVLSAPSGTGKTTLAHLLVESVPKLKISVSYTTRERRGNEQNDVDYHFVSQAIFQEKIAHNDFLEWAEVHGNNYGSSASWTHEMLQAGTNVIFDIDVQGGLQIKDKIPNTLLIFILPPSIEELEKRLRNRATESEEAIASRVQAAREEIKMGLDEYDYVITNELLDRALFDITALIRAKKLSELDRDKLRQKLLNN